jgi:NitT/TauT family transport system substrate-binding protein
MKRFLAAVVCLALAACAPPQTANEGDGVRIRFATDWRAQAEHGGF